MTTSANQITGSVDMVLCVLQTVPQGCGSPSVGGCFSSGAIEYLIELVIGVGKHSPGAEGIALAAVTGALEGNLASSTAERRATLSILAPRGCVEQPGGLGNLFLDFHDQGIQVGHCGSNIRIGSFNCGKQTVSLSQRQIGCCDSVNQLARWPTGRLLSWRAVSVAESAWSGGCVPSPRCLQWQ